MQNSETRCGSSTANESCTVSTASAKKVYAGKTDLSRGRPLYTSTTSKWCRTCVQSHRGRLRCYDGFLQASSQDYQIVFRWTDLHNCSRILLKESFLVYEIIGLLLPKKKGTLGAGAVSARPVVSFRQRFFLLQNPSVWSKAIFRSKVRPRGTLELHRCRSIHCFHQEQLDGHASITARLDCSSGLYVPSHIQIQSLL